MKHLCPPVALAFGFCTALLLLPAPLATAEPKDNAAKEAPVDYNRDVKPILSKNCFACHGPDAAGRASKLRLDRRDSVISVDKKGADVLLFDRGKSYIEFNIGADR